MVRLDSTKLMVNTDVINGISDAFLTSRINNTEGQLLTDKQQLTKIDLLGLKSVIIDNLSNKATIELSAKILGSDYFEGINNNTIQKAIETINSTGLIDLNVNKFIDTAEVLRTDVTDNIKPDRYGETFFETLASLPIAKKYHKDSYNTKYNLGVVYNGQQKTVRDRQIFYDKTKDLVRDKQFKNSPHAHKLFNQFKNVVRVESNHSQFKALNKHFGSRNLLKILNSPVKLNYNVFSRITDKTTDVNLRLFTQFEGMKFNQIRNFLGDKGIIELCNGDWQSIELFIRNFNKHNYRHYKNQIRTVYNTLNERTGETDVTIINHIKQLLYAC